MQSKIWPHFNKLNVIKIKINSGFEVHAASALLCVGLSSFELWQHHVGHGMGHTGHVQALMALEPQEFGPRHNPKPN